MMLELRGIDERKSRISELPDDIVVSIISYLTIKEAKATSVLSRTWRHMWKYTTGSWRFNQPEFCQKFGGCRPSLEYHDWVKRTEEDYVKRVNQALESHRGPFLYELGFCLDQTCRSSSFTRVIDNWISIASKKCVRRLDLDMPYLDLNKIVQTLPVFSQLTYLTLKHVYASEKTLCYFLSRCQLLEHLCVIECSKLEKLKVDGGSSLKLKHLEISDCYSLRSLEISAPNLVSFVCRGILTTVLFKDVPLLSTLSVGKCFVYNLKIIEPMSFVSQIESLTLEQSYRDSFHYGIDFGFRFYFRFGFGLSHPNLKLNNLKHLELRIRQRFTLSFLPYTWFLKTHPLLSSFKIDLGTFRNLKDQEQMLAAWNWRKDERLRKKEYLMHGANNYRHQCLRVVTLYGFLGYQHDTEFALHLIGLATSLEKMVIDCSQEIPMFPRVYWKKERSIARQNAKKLRSKLPPTTELVVL